MKPLTALRVHFDRSPAPKDQEHGARPKPGGTGRHRDGMRWPIRPQQRTSEFLELVNLVKEGQWQAPARDWKNLPGRTLFGVFRKLPPRMRRSSASIFPPRRSAISIALSKAAFPQVSFGKGQSLVLLRKGLPQARDPGLHSEGSRRAKSWIFSLLTEITVTRALEGISKCMRPGSQRRPGSISRTSLHAATQGSLQGLERGQGKLRSQGVYPPNRQRVDGHWSALGLNSMFNG